MSSTRTLGAPPALGRLVARSLLRRRRGDALPARRFELPAHRMERGALAAYQRVCGFDLSDTVPAPFVHVQAFPLAVALMADPAFPFPLLGLVHVGNRITQVRPVGVEEPLDLAVWAENRREHPAGQQVDLAAQARVRGELVWASTSTYVHRTKPPSGPQPRSPIEVASPTTVWWLPADLGRRYAGVSGDRNPIHLTPLTARAFGFRHAIVHGMWLNARVLAALSPRLPDAYTSEVAFKTPPRRWRSRRRGPTVSGPSPCARRGRASHIWPGGSARAEAAVLGQARPAVRA